MAYASKSVLGGSYSMSLSEAEARTVMVLAGTCMPVDGTSSSPVKHAAEVYRALLSAGLDYDSRTPERQALSQIAKFKDYPPVETLEEGKAYADAVGRILIRNNSGGWVTRTGENRPDNWAARPVKQLVPA